MAEWCYGTNNPRFIPFKRKGFLNVKDNKLIETANLIAFEAADAKIDLENWGLTPELISETQLLITDFKKAQDVTHSQVSTRSVNVFNRNQQFNNLYNTIKLYCKMGKRIWQYKNPVFYKDYVYSVTKTGTDEGLPPDTEPVNTNQTISNS